jgi:hypothetical protein
LYHGAVKCVANILLELNVFTFMVKVSEDRNTILFPTQFDFQRVMVWKPHKSNNINIKLMCNIGSQLWVDSNEETSELSFWVQYRVYIS